MRKNARDNWAKWLSCDNSLERLQVVGDPVLEEALAAEARDHRGDERRIEPPGQEDAKRHISHESLINSVDKSLPDVRKVEGSIGRRHVVPLWRVVAGERARLGRVVVTRGEDLDLYAAGGYKRFGLGGELGGAIETSAHIH